MKYILLLLFVFMCQTFSYGTFSAQAESTYYARIINDQTYIYSSALIDTLNQNAIFELPKTYFVELLAEANENFYYARYSDIYGYVKKDSVQVVFGSPVTPFLTGISFRVFVPSGANLRATPLNLGTTNLIYSIPFLETNLLYYGKMSGEEAISKKGTEWYYCKYYVNNLSYTGYVYAPLCDCLTTILPNQETFEVYTGNLEFANTTPPTNNDEFSGLSSTAQTVIIVAVSLPCLLFIYLLFKPTKIAESSKDKTHSHSPQKRAKISKLKRSDYFELDDDFS